MTSRDTERVIEQGHPTEREMLRRVTIGQIGRRRLLTKNEGILRRLDAAIVADAPRHLEYLNICISREQRNLERERGESEMIFDAITAYRRRIIEITIQLSQPRSRESAEAVDGAGGSFHCFSPPALCPA